MRRRAGSDQSAAVGLRMAQLSAELATLRARATEGDPEASDGGANQAAERTRVSDERWARWWPEDEDEDDYLVAEDGALREPGDDDSTSVRAAGRHSSRPGPPPRTRALRLRPVHLVVVCLLAALGLAFTTWWVVGSQPDVVEAPRPAAALVPATGGGPGAVTGQPAGTAATPGGAPPGNAAQPDVASEVVVHVAGKVRRPGVQVLPVGARVADALRAAGGARSGVDLTGLNLARPLVDGEQVLVGEPPASGAPSAASGTSAPGPATGAPPGAGPLVNLNTADQATLEELPGVGPVTARAILTYREQNGGFGAVDELIDVDGIGESTLADLSPLVTI